MIHDELFRTICLWIVMNRNGNRIFSKWCKFPRAYRSFDITIVTWFVGSDVTALQNFQVESSFKTNCFHLLNSKFENSKLWTPFASCISLVGSKVFFYWKNFWFEEFFDLKIHLWRNLRGSHSKFKHWTSKLTFQARISFEKRKEVLGANRSFKSRKYCG